MVRVAVAQIKVSLDVHQNLKKILEFIDRARLRKADIVCFPEVCLSNYLASKS